MPQFDVVIIGCGPAGERAALQAARAGKTVAVIERAQVVGGTCVNWGTIPSKTLRETALQIHRIRRNLEGFSLELPRQITIGDFMHRERVVVQRELELINETLDRNAVQVFHGSARFVDPYTVALRGVDGKSRMRIRGDVMVIATGTSPNRPEDVPFDGEVVFDSDTILSMPRMPRSMIVLGAGVIGIEYASIFSALSIDVTLVDTRPELLPYMDREIASILARELRKMGVVLVPGDRHDSITRVEGEPPFARCSTQSGNLLEADVLLYSVGRDGNTDNIGLDAIGVSPNKRGLLEVNEHYQIASHPHIYAVGDVIGYPALASTSMDQGRRAMSHAFGVSRPAIRTDLLPFAIYSLPEVSYIGQNEQELKAAGHAYVAGRASYDRNPRGQIIGDTGGMLKLLFDKNDGTLLGVHIVGHNASELVHTGEALIHASASALDIAEMPFNYPTLSDLYRHAASQASRQLTSPTP